MPKMPWCGRMGKGQSAGKLVDLRRDLNGAGRGRRNRRFGSLAIAGSRRSRDCQSRCGALRLLSPGAVAKW